MSSGYDLGQVYPVQHDDAAFIGGGVGRRAGGGLHRRRPRRDRAPRGFRHQGWTPHDARGPLGRHHSAGVHLGRCRDAEPPRTSRDVPVGVYATAAGPWWRLLRPRQLAAATPSGRRPQGAGMTSQSDLVWIPSSQGTTDQRRRSATITYRAIPVTTYMPPPTLGSTPRASVPG